MNCIESFNESELEALAKLCGNLPVGDRETTGSELTRYLRSAELPDSSPKLTKWVRVYNAFVEFQNEHHVGNNIVKFVSLLYSPCRYTECMDSFREEVQKLNKILALHGLEFQEDGKMHKVKKANTLSEAVQRAQRLKSQLEERKVHSKILQFADQEIKSDNYFHTVLEAMKSITSVIREKTGYYADGTQLVEATLTGNTPCLVINNYTTDSEKMEQKGFANLLKGLYGTFRNPLAHEPKIEWELSEADALDVLCMISYVHRKLERARRF